MGPLMLVNWHVVNVRFRALMWVLAVVLAFVIAVSALPKQTHTHQAPRSWNAITGPRPTGHLNGRP
jgi:hypothetical protein